LPVDQLTSPVGPPYIDVSGDNIVDAVDVLQMINRLNRLAQGEGEASFGVAPQRSVIPAGGWVSSPASEATEAGSSRTSDEWSAGKTSREPVRGADPKRESFANESPSELAALGNDPGRDAFFGNAMFGLWSSELEDDLLLGGTRPVAAHDAALLAVLDHRSPFRRR
jgi:hypothetical protein